MAKFRNAFVHEHKSVKKKTRAGAGKRSKGMKKYRGQGGSRKRCKQNCKSKR